MRTHQGSRALNHTKSAHAPYSANATNQVGPSTWKNFCLRNCMDLRNCMAWPKPQVYRLTRGFANVARVTRARRRTPGAPWPPGERPANTGLRSQNSTATHHKKPDPGVRTFPATNPPSGAPRWRFDALQGTRLAGPRVRHS